MSGPKESVSPERAAGWLRRRVPHPPALAIVLGSGFHPAAARLKVAARIPFRSIPGFPVPAVAGHPGEFLAGELGGVPVALLCGRVHYYEGHPMERVTFAVRVLAALGVRDLLLTNAAGGINPRFRPGDFMALTDHLNFMGASPLRGPVPPGRARFVDLSAAYDPGLRRLLQRAARRAGITLRRGVYLAVSGPNYETPAEIRAFARWGADAVGMSTVPEAIMARQYGLRVAGISCISNAAAGLSSKNLSHTEVLDTTGRVQATGAALLEFFAELYGQEQKK